MESKKALIAKAAKKAAEKALRKDANRTTCLAFYQPKAPADLKRFKNSK
jgi:cyclic lactone autoinducer peptide